MQGLRIQYTAVQKKKGGEAGVVRMPLIPAVKDKARVVRL
jgi:hypothetical protein